MANQSGKSDTSNSQDNLIQRAYQQAKDHFKCGRFNGSLLQTEFLLKRMPPNIYLHLFRCKIYENLNNSFCAYEETIAAAIIDQFQTPSIRFKVQNAYAKIEQANSELGIMLKSFELCGKTYNLPKSEFVDICELWKITDSYLFVKYPRTIELARDSRGFLAAMNAVHNHDVDDILPNCNAEISANGIYSNESRLLRAQMRCFDSKESRKDLNESMHDLIEIAQNVEIEESFRSEAELYMCRLHFELREYKLGNQKYEKLMKKQEFTRPTEFIRFWMGFDNCATAEEAYVKYGLDQFRCCYARLNTFSVAKFYIILYEYSSQQTDFSVFIKDLLDFYKTYPEIRTLKLIIVSYIQKKNYKDAYAFIRMKYSHDGKFIPFECGDEIPGTIEYLYGMIETEPDNLFNYTALANIYCEQNNDLLKAVECLNRAIKEMVYFKLFKKCFKLRQRLIEKINSNF